jgi:hypothetical protein
MLIENVPFALSAGDSAPLGGESRSSKLRGANSKAISNCASACITTCTRGCVRRRVLVTRAMTEAAVRLRSGPGAPGLGPLSQRGELIVFKQGATCCGSAPPRCAEVCVRACRLPQPSVLRERVRGCLRALVERTAACCGTVSNNACARLGVATRLLVKSRARRASLHSLALLPPLLRRGNPRPATSDGSRGGGAQPERKPRADASPNRRFECGFLGSPKLLRIAAFFGVNGGAGPETTS